MDSYSQITPICLKGGRSPKDSSKFFKSKWMPSSTLFLVSGTSDNPSSASPRSCSRCHNQATTSRLADADGAAGWRHLFFLKVVVDGSFDGDGSSLRSMALRAPAAPRSEPYLRLEQRIVPMLLKSMPEAIKVV